jgi:DNA-binding MarR family transcriptional regulator
MSQKDVLSRMIAPKSNITLIVKKLVVKELIVVQQSAMDKREYEINITEAGLCLLDQVGEALINNSGSIGKLNESEAFHLNALLDKLRDE